MRIKDYLAYLTKALKAVSDVPFLEAKILCSYVLNKNYSYLYAYADQVLEEKYRVQLEQMLQRRLHKEPIAYIVGHQEFYSHSFIVTPDTLIPRPETELLIDIALNYLPKNKTTYIIDAGTGSGVIAITLAILCMSWKIFAVDKSFSALQVAKKNIQHHAISNVYCIQADWLNAFAQESWDMVIANPPYIAENDSCLMHLCYEPQEALVSGIEGVDDLQVIIKQAFLCLSPGGWLILEHGHQQEHLVASLLKKERYHNIQLFFDIASLPRATIAQKL